MRNTVLLVDDDREDRALMIAGIEAGCGAAVEVVENGAQALEALLHGGSVAGDRYSVVFLDLAMPEVNGLDVLREVRREATLRNIPVVVFTSRLGDVEIWLSYKLGANAYLTKPADPRDFRVAVARAADFWVRINTLPSDWRGARAAA